VPDDLLRLRAGLETGDIKPGQFNTGNHLERFVAIWEEGGERFRAVFEVRPGRRNRAIALISLSIKEVSSQ
jgi:hypothetical protein